MKETGTSSTDVLCEKVLHNAKNISSDTGSSGNHNITTKAEEGQHARMINVFIFLFIRLPESLR